MGDSQYNYGGAYPAGTYGGSAPSTYPPQGQSYSAGGYPAVPPQQSYGGSQGSYSAPPPYGGPPPAQQDSSYGGYGGSTTAPSGSYGAPPPSGYDQTGNYSYQQPSSNTGMSNSYGGGSYNSPQSGGYGDGPPSGGGSYGGSGGGYGSSQNGGGSYGGGPDRGFNKDRGYGGRGGDGGGRSYGDRRGGGGGFGRGGDMVTQEDTIFVSGMPDTVTEEDVAKHFGVIGLVKIDKKTGGPKIWMYKDKVTGAMKGECTVTYDDPYTAKSAIEWFDNKLFMDRPIRVQMAERKKSEFERTGGRGGFSRGGDRGRGGRGGFDRGGRGGDRGGRGGGSGRQGDWKCPDEGCGNNNFSWRTSCNRCSAPRPEGVGGDDGGFRGGRGGGRGGFGGGRGGGRGGFGGGGRGGFGDRDRDGGGPMRAGGDRGPRNRPY